jgi:hypothetical protein
MKNSHACPSCAQYVAVGQGACPDCLAKFAALRIVPTDHIVRYVHGTKTVTKLAADLTPLKAIRAKCIDCSGGSPKVATECHILECSLWPYRLGRRPKFVKGAVAPGMPHNLVEGHLRGTIDAQTPSGDSGAPEAVATRLGPLEQTPAVEGRPA